MPNYIVRNKDELEKFHYVRRGGNDFSQLDVHDKKLNNEYRNRYGDNFCIVCYADDELDDCYIIPFPVLQDLFVHRNLCTEVTANLANQRDRWKFSITRHELKLFPNPRSGKRPPPIDVSRYYNVYGLLGPRALEIEAFPTQWDAPDRPVYNKVFEDYKPSSTKKRGYVYFIQDAGTGNIKIGYSDCPKRRLKNLQTGNPRILKLLDKIPGTKTEERALHRRFSSDRLEGEWFKADAILEFLEEEE